MMQVPRDHSADDATPPKTMLECVAGSSCVGPLVVEAGSMVAAARTIDVTPGSELDRLLEEANGTPLVFVKNGVRYRVEREDAADDIWANYDPERVRRALRESAGALAHIDREALKADIRAQRRQDSHGRPA